MTIGRKIERFVIWRQIGLFRIEGKATRTDYSLFCVCSEARTVYHSYYIHKYSTSEKTRYNGGENNRSYRKDKNIRRQAREKYILTLDRKKK